MIVALGSALLLLSAFFHASWNALTKRSHDKDGLLVSMTFISIFITLALILLTQNSWPNLPPRTWLFTFFSGVFEGLYMAALARAFSSASLGKAYAIMRGGAMVLVWAISLSFLGESTNLIHAIGAVVVLGGIFILSYNSTGQSQKLALSPWPFLSAIFITGYHICYHQALLSNADPQVLFLISMIVSFFILGISLKGQAISRLTLSLRTDFKIVVLTAFLSTASFLIFLYALRVSEPGYAISMRNSSIFFALIFSYILKESLNRVQIIGAVVIGVGTILLSLP